MTTDPQTSTGFLPVEGGELYYEVTGAGHPLVLIHAAVADLRQWDEQVPIFARRYRVIRYDMRGFGRTRNQVASFSGREDLYALLTHLGAQRAYLVGNSRGGQLAVDFTLEHPELVAALIPVAAGPSGYPFNPFPPPAHEAAAFAAMDEAEEARDWDRLSDLEARFWGDGPGQPAGRAGAQFGARLREMIRAGYGRDEPEATPRPLVPPAVGRLAEIRVPTLVVIGDLDRAGTQAAAETLAQGIPGARKVVIPGAAHVVNMERPDEFTRLVLDFLQSVEAQTSVSGAQQEP